MTTKSQRGYLFRKVLTSEMLVSFVISIIIIMVSAIFSFGNFGASNLGYSIQSELGLPMTVPFLVGYYHGNFFGVLTLIIEIVLMTVFFNIVFSTFKKKNIANGNEDFD